MAVEPISNRALRVSWKAPKQRTTKLFYAPLVAPAFGKLVKIYGCNVSADAAPTCTAFNLTGNTKYNISMSAHRTPDGNEAYENTTWHTKTRPSRKLYISVNSGDCVILYLNNFVSL